MTDPHVQFGLLQRRSLLLGLGSTQVILVSAALVVAVVAEYTYGLTGLVLTVALWGPLGAVGVLSAAGRPLVEWIPVVAGWATRRARSRTTQVRTPPRSPSGVVTAERSRPLPILVSRVGTAYLEDPRTHTLTATLAVTGSGLLLASGDAQGQLVRDWERLLASVCRRPEIARLHLIHRTVPTASSGLRQWWRRQLWDNAQLPARIVADVLADVEHRARRPESLLTVTLRPTGNRKGGPAEFTERADLQLHALTEGLAAASITVDGCSGFSARQLYRAIRTGYDPFEAVHIPPARDDDCMPGEGESPLAVVGPMGVRESWSQVTTDTACHAVYWIAEWPRADVGPGFLQPLVLSPEIVRTLTIVAEPVSTRRALRDIRRAQVEHTADSAQRERLGQHEDEATRVAGRDLTRREQDLVAGHGELAFTGLVTVTARSEAELTAACAATETAAAQAMCELRLLVGQQAAALTAAVSLTGRSPW